MKNSLKYSLLCGALMAILPAARLAAADEPVGRKEVAVVKISASVEAIDMAKREVTLKGPRGNVVTVKVDKEVKRLNEVKVGDLVSASYYVAAAAELRKPTPEEEENPLSVVEAGGKAPADAPPGAGVLQHIKAVVTIEAIDKKEQTVTVKGPQGNVMTLNVEHPENLEKAKVGDHVVLTYTEAMAIALEKSEPAESKKP